MIEKTIIWPRKCQKCGRSIYSSTRYVANSGKTLESAEYECGHIEKYTPLPTISFAER